jgi:hypothetical protein
MAPANQTEKSNLKIEELTAESRLKPATQNRENRFKQPPADQSQDNLSVSYISNMHDLIH